MQCVQIDMKTVTPGIFTAPMQGGDYYKTKIGSVNRALFYPTGAQREKLNAHAQYAEDYLKLVHLREKLPPAMRPLLKAYGTYTGTGHDLPHEDPIKVFWPYDSRIFHAQVLKERNSANDTQLVPAQAGKGGNDLLVRIRSKHSGSDSTKGDFMLPHNFNVHETCYLDPMAGICSEVLLTLRSGQVITIRTANRNETIRHTWDGVNLLTIHDTTVDGMDKTDRSALNVAEAIALRELLEQQAITGVSAMMNILRNNGILMKEPAEA